MSLHKEIAETIKGKTPYLVCEKCGKRYNLTAQDIERMLRYGWTKCCDLTMTYYKN